MRKISAFLLIFLGTFFYTQISKAHLVGIWRVENVSFNKKNSTLEQKSKMEMLKKMFLKSNFVFKNNNSVDFNFPSPEMAVKNGTWDLQSESIVSISKGKDKVMKFFVENKNGKFYFVLADFQFPYLILEVKK
jgi:hypothetical protein